MDNAARFVFSCCEDEHHGRQSVPFCLRLLQRPCFGAIVGRVLRTAVGAAENTCNTCLKLVEKRTLRHTESFIKNH